LRERDAFRMTPTLESLLPGERFIDGVELARPEELDGEPALGVLGTQASTVSSQSFIEVDRAADVQRAIAAPEHVHVCHDGTVLLRDPSPFGCCGELRVCRLRLASLAQPVSSPAAAPPPLNDPQGRAALAQRP